MASPTRTMTAGGVTHPVTPPTALLPLEGGLFALVDADQLPYLTRWTWVPIQRRRGTYAYMRSNKTGAITGLGLHRMIARTPRHLVTHHRNRNPLDCRRSNLINMTHHAHELTHRNARLLIRFTTPTPDSLYDLKPPMPTRPAGHIRPSRTA